MCKDLFKVYPEIAKPVHEQGTRLGGWRTLRQGRLTNGAPAHDPRRLFALSRGAPQELRLEACGSLFLHFKTQPASLEWRNFELRRLLVGPGKMDVLFRMIKLEIAGLRHLAVGQFARWVLAPQRHF